MKKITQRVIDEAAIRRLIDGYCHYVDRGSADEVAALFHPDATLIATFEEDGRYKGRAAIQQWYADYHANFRSKLEHLRHKISNVLIDLDRDEARAVSYMDADCVELGQHSVLPAIGRYDDRFIREGKDWFFSERAIVIYEADSRLVELLTS